MLTKHLAKQEYSNQAQMLLLLKFLFLFLYFEVYIILNILVFWDNSLMLFLSDGFLYLTYLDFKVKIMING